MKVCCPDIGALVSKVLVDGHFRSALVDSGSSVTLVKVNRISGLGKLSGSGVHL